MPPAHDPPVFPERTESCLVDFELILEDAVALESGSPFDRIIFDENAVPG